MAHNAYKLTHKLTIQHNASDGTTVDNWQTFCTTMAEKTGLGMKGKLFQSAAATQSESQVVFTIHYRNDIQPLMRIIDNGDTDRSYEIVDDPVDPDDRRMWLEIRVRRIESGGS